MPDPKKKDADASLETWAANVNRHHGDKAWLETIPEWDEVIAGFRAGIPLPDIGEWLVKKKGYAPEQVTTGKLSIVYKKYPRSRG